MTKASQRIRAPAVAGQFYPGDRTALCSLVDAELARAGSAASTPLAVISPHAGYRFSGRLSALALGATRSASPDTIVILSPSHRHAFEGIALPSAEVFRLPCGDVSVDLAVRDMLLAANHAHVCDAAHDSEHGIEVQLPFLRALHPEARIVPLVIGKVDDKNVSELVDFLHDRIAPLFILSSDLSHFLKVEDAVKRDSETARKIETGSGIELSGQDACGAKAIVGFLGSDLARGARFARLTLSNSHGAGGDAARTVGYGAWAVFAGSARVLADDARTALLRTARQALASRLRRGKTPEVNVASFSPPIQTHAASFVTLRQSGRLRGCIGSLAAHRPLVEDVALNAVKAGFEDPRFADLTPEELEQIDIKVAVLSPSRPMQFDDQKDLEAQLTPGLDGLILADGQSRGTFLPMVWDQLATPQAFVDGLKVKAGLGKSYWSKTLTVQRFHAESFGEQVEIRI